MKGWKANDGTYVRTRLNSGGVPDLLGLGSVTSAIVLTAYSHPGRISSEVAFAALAGVNPMPATSGITTRHVSCGTATGN
jgi:hypothetical protein